MKHIIYIILTIPFFTGCTADFLKKIISDNPDIIVESIKKNPSMYLNALMDAQRADAKNRRKKQMAEELEKQQKEFDNPKKPELKKSRMYLGDKKAPITIVEYFDFQCGYCAKVVPTIKELIKTYPKDVRVLLKHKPLFPGSADAAAYFEAVGMQSSKKAQKFHDMVFAKPRAIKLSEKFLKQLSKKLKVNMTKLKKDLKIARDIVESDSKEAQKFGFSGTPGFLVGGVSVPGAVPLGVFKKIIDKHLDRMNKK